VSSYKEIVERANVALDEASARCRKREAEILRQRAAALDAVASAREAIARHDAAVVKLSNDFALAQAKAVAERDAGEAQADDRRRQAEDEALAAWRAADDDALAALRAEVEAADLAYDEGRRSGAIGSVNVSDRLRIVHDNALATATRKYQQAKDNDYDAYRRGLADADVERQTALHRARAKADEAVAIARAAHDAAIEAAAAALAAALSADRAAQSIVTTFDQQLEAARQDCEREKAAIIDQMRRDLGA
jgi:hypothetical protein